MAPQQRRPQVVAAAAAVAPAPTPASAPGPGVRRGYESPAEAAHPGSDVNGGADPPTPQRQSGLMTAMRPPFTPRPSFLASPPNELVQTLDDMLSKVERQSPSGKVSIKDRIACYQWTYFTMTMATGGIANVLHALPYSANWITGIGLLFFMLNMVLFLINVICLTTRFRLRPGSFTHSFTDQVESLFIPSFFVSISIIMINICEYGIPHAGMWLLRTMQIMFWMYAVTSVLVSAGLYLVLWSTQVFPVHTMTPTWVFPAYPLLLTAPLAANLIASAELTPHANTLNKPAVALCAATIQGMGCLIAFMISAAFIYRLMTQKLPRDMQRPGVFISIGPFGFTAAGISQLGSQAKVILPPGFLGSDISVDIVRVVCVLVALWLWGLCIWFFLVSVGSLWKYTRAGHSMPFQVTWWSFVFPNTALVTATDNMSKIFQSSGLKIAGAVMTAALIIVWVSIFFIMLRCLKQKKLLWPKDRHDDTALARS